MGDTFVLGIAGGSGSGKSTLVEHILKSEHAGLIAHLAHDSYYRNAEQMPAEVRNAHNWDHPDALDNALFVEHIDALRAGLSVKQPIYDFATHSRTSETRLVEPGRILLLEGILLLAIPEVRQRIDLRVFVEASAEERVMRRIVRDVRERGRTVGSVVEQFRATVGPMYEQYVAPSRRYAHVIVPWELGVDHQPIVDLLLARVRVATTR